MGAFKRYFVGAKEEYPQIQRYTQQQRSALDNFLAQGQKYTDIEGQDALARKRFNEETLPSIYQRYGRFGGSGTLQNEVGRAGADLEAQLRAMREQYGLKASQLGLTPQFDTGHKAETYGLLGELGPAAIDVAKTWATMGLNKTKTPPPSQPYDAPGIRPGEAGYPDDVPGWENYGSGQMTQPASAQGNPVFNQLFDMKQAASPQRSRYTNLFGNNPNQRQPYNAMMDNPMLAKLLGMYGNGNMPGSRRPFPMKQTNNFSGY